MIGRPTIAQNGELKKSGEDLEAQGLTEYMWDVLYWSWGCTSVASLFGNRAWWMWIVIPSYSVWLAWTTFGGIRQSMAGPQAGKEVANESAPSKRQAKLDKRGGQKVQYR